MSSMLVFGLLIGVALVTLADAKSWSVAIQAVKRAQRNNTLSLSDVYGQALTSTTNSIYWGTVYVGTPPVPFNVVFDTGSETFWIPKKGCKATGRLVQYCHRNFELYDPSVSATAEATNEPFYIKYATGSARGHNYKDFLTFGSALRFKEPIMVGAGESMKHSDQGVVGLPSLYNPDKPGTSVMHEAWRQNILDEPIFTIHMRVCPVYEDGQCHDSGLITFGGLDKTNCGKVIDNVNLHSDSHHWQFDVSQLKMGRGRVKNIKALSDSGTNHIAGPQEEIRKIMEAIGATPAEGYYTVRCNTDVTVTLTINCRHYTIPSNKMLFNLHNGRCVVLLNSNPRGKWVLGTPFTSTFCMVHNIEKRTIGFAKSRT